MVTDAGRENALNILVTIRDDYPYSIAYRVAHNRYIVMKANGGTLAYGKWGKCRDAYNRILEQMEVME